MEPLPALSDPAVPRPRPRLDAVAPFALVACLVLLAIPALDPRGSSPSGGLAALRTSRDLSAFLIRLALWGAIELLRAAPLGFLAVSVFRDRDRRRDRALRVALPAAALSLGGAALAMWIAAPPAGPGQLRLLLAACGVAVGLAAALAWRRGRAAVIRLGLGVLALAALILLASGAVASLAIEREARAPEPAPIGSADKRRIYDLVRGKNPRRVPDGETRSVYLTSEDLDRLSAWGSSITRRGHGLVRIEGPGTLSAEASIRLPWPRGRWLNVATRLRLGVEQGRVDLAVLALRVGRIAVPRWVLGILSPIFVREVTSEPRIRAALPAVHLVRIDARGAAATFSRLEVPRGTLGGLMWGEDLAGVSAQVGAYVARLLEVLPRSPRGDPRFAAALDAAFALARERSRGASALEENRAALIALGIVLGHPRISSFIGDPLDEDRTDRIDAVRAAATVRGRNDWVRHFTVSGALVALSWVAPSNAAGLFKEERDAARGSGFSFGDLLADRAGATFADAATRDEAAAARLQERLAHGVSVEALFPPAADLPEDIPAAELERRYGGVGGPLFRRYAEEIERRVASCGAYRK